MTNGLRDLRRLIGTTMALMNVAAAAAGQDLPRAHVGAGLGLTRQDIAMLGVRVAVTLGF